MTRPILGIEREKRRGKLEKGENNKKKQKKT